MNEKWPHAAFQEDGINYVCVSGLGMTGAALDEFPDDSMSAREYLNMAVSQRRIVPRREMSEEERLAR